MTLKRTLPLVLVAILFACIDLPDIEPADPSTTPDAGTQPVPPDGGPPDSGMPDAGNAVCGDGKTEAGETCDDGNTVDETACPYGTANCTSCNATCTGRLDLTGLYCGDGVVSLGETCDDGNNSPCGTCNETCARVQNSRASGTMTAIHPDGIADGDFFYLNDGINPAVRFEFDKNGAVQADSVRIDVSSRLSAQEVAEFMADDISYTDKPLGITARWPTESPGVELYNDLRGSFGNQPITGSIISAGFQVNGMVGGSGSDCPANTRCTQNDDCAPGLVCRSEKVCGVP